MDKDPISGHMIQGQESHGVFIDFARWILRLCGIDNTSEIVATLIMIMLSAAFSVLLYWVAKSILFRVVKKIVERTPSKWDDCVFNDTVLKRASYLPSIFSMMAFGIAMQTDNWLNILYMKVVYLYMTFCIGRFISALLDSLFDLITTTYPKARSLKSIKQLITYVIVAMMIIVMVSVVIGRSPVALLTGLGASAAVMSLVFKETIQSLVSGIQLSANSMVEVGDWIVVPKANANGVVTEITLNTVKIRNWDNTITTVPPSTLMSDAFTNWKGMSEGAGRRLTRSIMIDMGTVRFLSAEELRSYEGMSGLSQYFSRRKEGEAEAATNLTLFREYMVDYLLNNPAVCAPDNATGMKVMVRYLQPTQYGLPVEMYCFTKTKEWVGHEAIISQLVDHMVAVLGTFGLKAYQVANSENAKGDGAPSRIEAPKAAAAVLPKGGES